MCSNFCNNDNDNEEIISNIIQYPISLLVLCGCASCIDRMILMLAEVY